MFMNKYITHMYETCQLNAHSLLSTMMLLMGCLNMMSHNITYSISEYIEYMYCTYI